MFHALNGGSQSITKSPKNQSREASLRISSNSRSPTKSMRVSGIGNSNNQTTF